MSTPYNVSYRGLRVPWVTRWSAEVIPFGQHDLEAAVAYMDDGTPPYLAFVLAGNYKDKPSLVEKNVLWLPEDNHMQGQGAAQFSQVSTTRQVQCMRKLLCQVCSMPVKTGPLRWLMPKSAMARMKHFRQASVTQSPPVCDDCIPVALRLCPHLRTTDWTILVEPDVALVGVSGYIGVLKDNSVTPFEGGAPYVEGELVLPDRAAALGKQQVVSLSNYTEEKP